jgi:cell division protein FtsL
MKRILFTALFLGSIATYAQKIVPVKIGIEKVADSISVSVMTFKTTDKSCQLYYEIFDNKKQQIDNGNLEVTEQEFTAWGETNKYIENLALTKLKLTRKTN